MIRVGANFSDIAYIRRRRNEGIDYKQCAREVGLGPACVKSFYDLETKKEDEYVAPDLTPDELLIQEEVEAQKAKAKQALLDEVTEEMRAEMRAEIRAELEDE